MDIEEDIKKLNKYIELVIDKDYCDCNELNVIIGKHCDGSKNVAYAIKNTLAEREEDKKRIKELEDENRVQRHQIMEVFDRGYIHKDKIKDDYIPKQKVKEELEKAKKENEPYEIHNKESRMFWINQGKIRLAKKLLEEK